MTYTETAYKILTKVYQDGAYSNIELHKELESSDEAALVTRIVLGVLDKDTELEYIVAKICQKPPKSAVKIILKQGIYCVRYMDSLPDYAVVNNHVNLAKKVGLGAYAGFLNATLKTVIREKVTLPDKEADPVGYFSVKYSKPKWLVRKLFSDYGRADAAKIITAKPKKFAHIRLNSLKMTKNSFECYAKKHNLEYSESTVGGYYVKDCPEIKRLFSDGRITYQSETSVMAALAVAPKEGSMILDLCSAPGGKAVLLAELDKGGAVLACDVHEHRVELVKAYAKRMGVTNVQTVKLDARKFYKNFENRFDYVLCDVPCSGLGVVSSRPDILLNKKPEDILELTEIQKDILSNAAKYLKVGGALVYSTCTVIKEENIRQVENFLRENPNFSLEKIDLPPNNDGTLQILPTDKLDGFFIARMVKHA